jgi:hypothetical protein
LRLGEEEEEQAGQVKWGTRPCGVLGWAGLGPLSFDRVLLFLFLFRFLDDRVGCELCDIILLLLGFGPLGEYFTFLGKL